MGEAAEQQGTDTRQLRNKDQIDKSFPNDFENLPFPYNKVKDKLIDDIQTGKIDEFYGIDDTFDVLRIYHGTTDRKLPHIAEHGMRAFQELEHQEPRIYVTASPTMALWHVINNGPHDTLRKAGNIDTSETEGNPMLLVIQVDKEWLRSHPDSQKSLSLPNWLKQNLNIKNEVDMRYSMFIGAMRSEVESLKSGHEASDFGIKFPTDYIPPEFISVQSVDGERVSVSDFQKGVNRL